MYVSFADDSWKIDTLTYAYTKRFRETPELIQRDGWVENGENPSGCDEKYGYVTVLTKEKVSGPVKITARFSFEGLAAPLITMAKELTPDENGALRYGDYKEIVVWKHGINVWDLWQEGDKVIYRLMLGMEYPVAENEIHTLEAVIEQDTFTFTLDDRKTTVRIADMYDSFHLGIATCEGICKLYDMKIGELA